MISKIKTAAVWLLLAIAAVFAAFRKGKNQGEQDAKDEWANEQLEAAKRAKGNSDSVAAMSNSDVANRLRDDWTR